MQVNSVKFGLKALGNKCLNVETCFQVLLSSSTCATTSWEPTASALGKATHSFPVSAQREPFCPRPRRRIPYTQSPIRLSPEPPESSLSTNQGHGEMTDCPLTNQGP